MDQRKALFMEHFQAPSVAKPYLEAMFSPEEIRLGAVMEPSKPFSKESVAEVLGEGCDLDRFITDAYRHGVISYTDDTMTSFQLGNFYESLDIFAISRQEEFRDLPEEGQKAMADWAFDTFYNRLNPDPAVRPGADVILPLDQVLDFIEERRNKPVYLNHCDCKSLNGACGKPTHVCITYNDGINTYVHRGLSQKMMAEEAKQVVMDADRAGLMHTVNGETICNCCDDCCYLFRSQERRHSAGFWPRTENIISWNGAKCVHCGLCTRRCMFHVFTKPGDRIAVDTSHCVGCGICATACPKGALSLIPRETGEVPAQ